MIANADEAKSHKVPAFASIGFSEVQPWGGATLMMQLVWNQGHVVFESVQMDNADPGYYLIKENRLPTGKKTSPLKPADFEKVWKLVETLSLRQSPQVEADRPPPDGEYSFLLLRWGETSEHFDSNQLVFRINTPTFQLLNPLVLALKEILSAQPPYVDDASDVYYKFGVIHVVCGPAGGYNMQINFFNSETNCSSNSKALFVIDANEDLLEKGHEIALKEGNGSVSPPGFFDEENAEMRGVGVKDFEKAKSVFLRISKSSRDQWGNVDKLTGSIELQFIDHTKSRKFIAKGCNEILDRKSVV